jgi:hypothetical protein
MKASEVDFEKLYQDHLPNEAVDLKEFVENLNSKNINKGQSDINKWKKEGI